jgi:hypothetical protein
MTLRYQSGEEIRPRDRVEYHGASGEIELVIDPDALDPACEWYLNELGAGVMIAEPRVFGRVFVGQTEEDEDLVFVSRQDGT